MKKAIFIITGLVLLTGLLLGNAPLFASAQAPKPEPAQVANPDLVALGKLLFFDMNLSANGTQSCATCHAPGAGFVGADSQVNASTAVYPGALAHRFGNRKPPSAAYAGDSPILFYDAARGSWFGGMFWDGRATGATLGDPLAEQAQGPYLNPLEQALPDSQALCSKVAQSTYAGLFIKVWGAGSLNCTTGAAGVYERIGRSVAAYERSAEVNPYSSKFDLFWNKAKSARKDVTKIKCGTGGGMGSMGCPSGGTNAWASFRNLGLNDAELQGLAIFNDRAKCASCHSLQPGPAGYPLFTDFGFDNIGLPKNPANPFYSMPAEWNPAGNAWIDTGLGGYLQSAGYPAAVFEKELGKFKVPTLRNVDKRPAVNTVKAYGHNGAFKSLEDIVTFYHWRGMMDSGCGGMGGMSGMGGCGMAGMFPAPEVDQNRAVLTVFPRMQVSNVVAFLKTLSDGYKP